jgi:hypothetical protein
MAQQFPGMPGVLCGNQVHFFEDSYGPKRHVFEVTDWSGDNIKGSGHGVSHWQNDREPSSAVIMVKRRQNFTSFIAFYHE